MPELIDIILTATDQEGTESLLAQWFKQPGEAVRQHEPVLEISTDKVTLEIPAPAGGILKEILKQPNEPVLPGDVLGRIEVAVETAAHASPPAPLAGEKPGNRERLLENGEPRERRLSPVVRRMLSHHNLQPEQITGSGRDGRITARDVEAFLAGLGDAPAIPESADRTVPDAPAAQRPAGASRMVPHNTVRIRTAQHMVTSMLNTAPHVTALFDADMSAVIAHRNAHKADFEKKGLKLTYTAYFVAAAAQALEAVPEVNSRWHDHALEIFADCNVGIATATGQGLMVPVIHKAQDLNLQGIARRLQEITTRARENKLSPADVQNGTFTITNHGVTGSLLATPIIHQPQSAILGIGKLEKRIVVVEKGVLDVPEIRPMIYVTLTIDHRALDGFQANAFLGRFVEVLQSW